MRSFFLKLFCSSFLLLLFLQPIHSVETTITGDSMELIDKGESVLFIGNVKLMRGTDIIKANWMETSKYKDKVKAKGKVELLRFLTSGDKIKAYGEEAFYNADAGDGFIFGRKKLSHVIYNQVLSSTSTRVLDMFADRFNFSENASTGTAVGNVYGKSTAPESEDLYEFWSEQADMNHQEKTIHLSGAAQPKVRQVNVKGNRTIEGDSIVYFYDTKNFEATGRAKAVFIDQNEEEK